MNAIASSDTVGGSVVATYIVVIYTDFAARVPERDFRKPQRLSNLQNRRLPMIDTRALAAHVLRALASAQSRGRLVRTDELALSIGVRRDDVRYVITQLHAEGHVDAERMRLTMTGLALAASMRECKLAQVRRESAYIARVA
jgi:hypothetical protein